jgi:hypothetical protein
MNEKKEKCFYCEKIALYNQLVNYDGVYTVTGVCRNHLIIDIS